MSFNIYVKSGHWMVAVESTKLKEYEDPSKLREEITGLISDVCHGHEGIAPHMSYTHYLTLSKGLYYTKMLPCMNSHLSLLPVLR